MVTLFVTIFVTILRTTTAQLLQKTAAELAKNLRKSDLLKLKTRCVMRSEVGWWVAQPLNNSAVHPTKMRQYLARELKLATSNVSNRA